MKISIGVKLMYYTFKNKKIIIFNKNPNTYFDEEEMFHLSHIFLKNATSRLFLA